MKQSKKHQGVKCAKLLNYPVTNNGLQVNIKKIRY